MKVSFITGSRADWNGLGMVAKAFKADPRFEVSVIATGQHLERGTIGLIRDDGFDDPDRAWLDREGDRPQDIAAAIGNCTIRIAEVLAEIRPDLVVLLGDRYEILAAAIAAATLRIPIAHMSGGDVTEGSLDDKYRNAITMMADLHFPTNQQAADNIFSMRGGYDCLTWGAMYMVGAPALDRIRETSVTMDKADFCQSVGLDPDKQNILVAMHPVTTDAEPAAQCREVVEALQTVDAGLLVLGTNADAGNSVVACMLRNLGGSRYVENLTAPMFYAALTHMDLMIGNSSAGIYETAGFGIPVVNVGNRQAGRQTPANVPSCAAEAGAITQAISTQLARGSRPCPNPYGDGHSSARIVEIVAKHFGLMQ